MLKLEFVGLMPKQLDEGVLYVSMEYATAIHLCACGCGSKVVTPLSPADWSLHFNGESVSLSPSIGNWNFHCRSHYWITDSNICWQHSWNEDGDIKRVKNKLKKRRSVWQYL